MFTQIVTPKNQEGGRELLQKCRQVIDQAKGMIDSEIQRTDQKLWDLATNQMELSRHVAQDLRGRHGIPKDASNAFFKAIELFNLIGPHIRDSLKLNGGTLRMFDNASLPGDFIRAMNWWLEHRSGHTAEKDENSGPAVLDWRANSLTGGLDDRFGLMRDHPQKWMQNVVNGIWSANTSSMVRHHCASGRPKELPANAELRPINGDVADMANRLDICQHLEAEKWKADVYTSDLGFAVQSYYKEEEEHLEAHLGQCLLGMDVLRLGGALVVKTFTMSEVRTMGMICHMMERFDNFFIVKPETSKPDNSECYWVCLGYRGQITHDPYGAREIRYDQGVVLAQQLLARRQAQKITQNVADYRRICKQGGASAMHGPGGHFRRYHKQFAPLVQRWCARHIGANTTGADPPVSHASAAAPQ